MPVVSEAYTSRPTVGGFSGLPPLLAEAVVLLRASNYTPGSAWANEGTGGSAFNAVATGTPQIDTNFAGAGIDIGGPEGVGPYFHVPDGAAIKVGTGSFTAFARIRWLTTSTGFGNVMSKISGVMGVDGFGWQVVDIVGLGAVAIAGNGGANPGVDPAFAVDPAGLLAVGEHLMVIRVDRTAGDMSLFIDNTERSAVPITGVANTDVAHELIFGRNADVPPQMQIGRAYGFWSRALTDTEVTVTLPTQLGFS